MPCTINIGFVRSQLGLDVEKQKLKFTTGGTQFSDETMNSTVRVIKENHKGILQLQFYFIGLDDYEGMDRDQLDITLKQTTIKKSIVEVEDNDHIHQTHESNFS